MTLPSAAAMPRTNSGQENVIDFAKKKNNINQILPYNKYPPEINTSPQTLQKQGTLKSNNKEVTRQNVQEKKVVFAEQNKINKTTEDIYSKKVSICVQLSESSSQEEDNHGFTLARNIQTDIISKEDALQESRRLCMCFMRSYSIHSSKLKQADYEQMVLRRQWKPNSLKQLTVATLEQLLEQARSKELITLTDYLNFISNQGIFKVVKFMRKMAQRKIQQFNANKYIFTILDHRRLAETLVELYPGQYKIDANTTCFSLTKEVNPFLRQLYLFPARDYWGLCLVHDKLAQTKWWLPIQRKLETKRRQARLQAMKRRRLQQELEGKQGDSKMENKLEAKAKKIEEKKAKQEKMKKELDFKILSSIAKIKDSLPSISQTKKKRLRNSSRVAAQKQGSEVPPNQLAEQVQKELVLSDVDFSGQQSDMPEMQE